MAFAILRTAKLKTIGNIASSLSHNYRTRETPNADQNRSSLNEHSVESAQAVKDAIQERLPEKRRSDAVLCIEHLITASPEWSGWGTSQERDFFEKSKKWLDEKYGAQNVVATTIHRDETTPHLVAYVVPLDADTGRLNAKKWLGGRHKLSRMQTDFANEVKNLGLERGIEGSKAEHTTIRDYYKKIEDLDNVPKVSVDRPEPEFFESKDKYGQRVVESVIEQVNRKVEETRLLANEVKTARKELSEARKTLSELQARTKPYLDAIHGLERRGIEFMNKHMLEVREKINEKRRAYEREQIQQRIRERERRFEKSFDLLNEQQQRNFTSFSEHLKHLYPNDPALLESKLSDLRQKVIDQPTYFSKSASLPKRKEMTRNEDEAPKKKRSRGMDLGF